MKTKKTNLCANAVTTPQALQFRCDLQITAGSDDQNLPRFSMVAYTGGMMKVNGFEHPVIVDLEGMEISRQNLPIRLDHNSRQGVGHTEKVQVKDGQIVADGLISRDTSWARDVANSGTKGFPWQASIGAEVLDSEFVPSGQTVQVNGRTFDGPVYIIRKSVLKEISFVDNGADTRTSAKVAAEQSLDFSPQSSGSGYRSDAGTEAVEQMRNQIVAEKQRIQAIQRICKDQHVDIEARAIAEGWDVTRCELEVLRASRPKAPAVHVQRHEMTPKVLEAAALLSGRMHGDALVAEYGHQAVELADKRFKRDLGLQELLLEAAWANGYTGRTFREDRRSVMRYAFRHDLQAAGSTIDIGGILSNVANKFLLEGFYSVEGVWRNLCAIRNVSDFKTVTRYRLIGKDQYERVAPGGEIKHGTLGEETYSNKADTYALMLEIDRHAIINDDMDAITAVPRKLGRGSGLKINDVFWSTFLDNADFFKADNKNYADGAQTALSIDGLTEAEVAFMDQVDAEGKPIGIMPAILVVPTALSALATQLYKSLEIRNTTSSTKYPVANPHQGKFRVEVSRYLRNSTYTGASDKAWYLLSDPNDLAVIEMVFLNGQESPTIETTDADFNVLGIRMRGYHDFGAALQDPKAGVKMKGEA